MVKKRIMLLALTCLLLLHGKVGMVANDSSAHQEAPTDEKKTSLQEKFSQLKEDLVAPSKSPSDENVESSPIEKNHAEASSQEGSNQAKASKGGEVFVKGKVALIRMPNGTVRIINLAAHKPINIPPQGSKSKEKPKTSIPADINFPPTEDEAISQQEVDLPIQRMEQPSIKAHQEQESKVSKVEQPTAKPPALVPVVQKNSLVPEVEVPVSASETQKNSFTDVVKTDLPNDLALPPPSEEPVLSDQEKMNIAEIQMKLEKIKQTPAPPIESTLSELDPILTPPVHRNVPPAFTESIEQTPAISTIQKGDTIELNVPDEPDLNKLRLKVGPDGMINLPYIGSIYLAGKSQQDASETIRDKLKSFYKDPIVALNIVDFSTRVYSIMGEVFYPGTYSIPQMQNSLTVTQAVAQAGGMLERKEIGKVTINRMVEGTMHRIESDKYGVPTKEMIILPGDTVIVSSTSNTFSLLGEVRRQGVFSMPPMKGGIHLMEAIAMAGGTARFADLGMIKVKRSKDGKEEIISFDGKDIGRNVEGKTFEILPGDTVIVTQAKSDFVVLGQVNRPGSYPIPAYEDSIDLLEAIAVAGGVTRLGDLRRIKIRRIIDGKEKVINADAKELTQEESSSVPIYPGDRIIVTERRF